MPLGNALWRMADTGCRIRLAVAMARRASIAGKTDNTAGELISVIGGKPSRGNTSRSKLVSTSLACRARAADFHVMVASPNDFVVTGDEELVSYIRHDHKQY
jgi:hypothetical protein